MRLPEIWLWRRSPANPPLRYLCLTSSLSSIPTLSLAPLGFSTDQCIRASTQIQKSSALLSRVQNPVSRQLPSQSRVGNTLRYREADASSATTTTTCVDSHCTCNDHIFASKSLLSKIHLSESLPERLLSRCLVPFAFETSKPTTRLPCPTLRG